MYILYIHLVCWINRDLFFLFKITLFNYKYDWKQFLHRGQQYLKFLYEQSWVSLVQYSSITQWAGLSGDRNITAALQSTSYGNLSSKHTQETNKTSLWAEFYDFNDHSLSPMAFKCSPGQTCLGASHRPSRDTFISSIQSPEILSVI